MAAYYNRKRKASYKGMAKRTKAMHARQGSRDNYVTAPKSVGFRSTGHTQASYMSDPDGSVYVTHREYVLDVIKPATTLGAYVNIPPPLGLGLRLNPGSEIAFPWTSGLARNFEKYQIMDLKYTYKPLAGTDEAGTIMMAIDYKPSDAAPADKGKMLLLTNASRASVWTGTTLRCDPSNLEANNAELISNDADVPSRTTAIAELTQTDVGNLFIAAQGMVDAATTCGEIWVDYTVRLYNPKEPGLYWGQLDQLLYYRTKGLHVRGGSACTTTLPFDYSGGGFITEDGGLNYTLNNRNIVFHEPGYYNVILEFATLNAGDSWVPDIAWDWSTSTVTDAAGTFIHTEPVGQINNLPSHGRNHILWSLCILAASTNAILDVYDLKASVLSGLQVDLYASQIMITPRAADPPYSPP